MKKLILFFVLLMAFDHTVSGSSTRSKKQSPEFDRLMEKFTHSTNAVVELMRNKSSAHNKKSRKEINTIIATNIEDATKLRQFTQTNPKGFSVSDAQKRGIGIALKGAPKITKKETEKIKKTFDEFSQLMNKFVNSTQALHPYHDTKNQSSQVKAKQMLQVVQSLKYEQALTVFMNKNKNTLISISQKKALDQANVLLKNAMPPASASKNSSKKNPTSSSKKLSTHKKNRKALYQLAKKYVTTVNTLFNKKSSSAQSDTISTDTAQHQKKNIKQLVTLSNQQLTDIKNFIQEHPRTSISHHNLKVLNNCITKVNALKESIQSSYRYYNEQTGDLEGIKTKKCTGICTSSIVAPSLLKTKPDIKPSQTKPDLQIYYNEQKLYIEGVKTKNEICKGKCSSSVVVPYTSKNKSTTQPTVAQPVKKEEHHKPETSKTKPETSKTKVENNNQTKIKKVTPAATSTVKKTTKKLVAKKANQKVKKVIQPVQKPTSTVIAMPTTQLQQPVDTQANHKTK